MRKDGKSAHRGMCDMISRTRNMMREQIGGSFIPFGRRTGCGPSRSLERSPRWFSGRMLIRLRIPRIGIPGLVSISPRHDGLAEALIGFIPKGKKRMRSRPGPKEAASVWTSRMRNTLYSRDPFIIPSWRRRRRRRRGYPVQCKFSRYNNPPRSGRHVNATV